MNLAPVLDPPKDDRGKNGIISVSKHFLGYDSWTNNDLQISVSESPKDIPVTMMSSVRFTHISDRPAVFDENIVKMARQYAPDMVIFKRPIAAIIDAGNLKL